MQTIYADGGQNPEFAHTHLADVSRPEALASGSTDWVVAPAGKKVSPVVKMAAKKSHAPADPSDRTSSIKKTATDGKPQAAL